MIRKKAANAKVKAKARPKSRREPGTRMSVLLSNPDYLLEGFVEKRCFLLGVIEDIPTNSDISSRYSLLSALDTHRNIGQLPWQPTRDHEVTLTLSAYNIKIVREGRTNTLLHRIPIHEVAAASYINDDEQHLLFIKAGDAAKHYCPYYVLCCEKRADAEEACSILQQAFQLVYTEATMQHLNESITAGEVGERMRRESRGQGKAKPRATAMAESASGTENNTLVSHGTNIDDTMDSDSSDSSSGEEVTAEELVQSYMERLHKLLDFKELREFATLLRRYRDDLPVREFLTQLKSLYGTQRTFLIPDMCSFIPEEDRAVFEEFVAAENLPTGALKRGSQTSATPASKPHPPPVQKGPGVERGRKGEAGKDKEQRKRRSRQHTGHVTDVEKFLQDIDLHMDSVLDDTN